MYFESGYWKSEMGQSLDSELSLFNLTCNCRSCFILLFVMLDLSLLNLEVNKNVLSLVDING
jgi:hypothetical protein